MEGSNAPRRKRVVIVGASWAGLAAAKALAPGMEVTVVDPKDFLEFTPSLHTVLGGSRDAAELLVPLDEALVPGCRFVAGNAIDLDNGAVIARTCAGLARLEYDYALLACGCSYPAPLRETPDALAQTRGARLERLRMARASLVAAASVLVAGGGAVGVEVACELAADGIRVTLATAAHELVPDMPAAARKRAAAALAWAGVDVRYDVRALRVGPTIASSGGGAFDLGGPQPEAFDAYLQCFGTTPATAWLRGTVRLDPDGFVEVDAESLRATFLDGVSGAVFAAGDVMAKPDTQRLASYAHLEGEYVAAHIAAAATGAPLPRAYEPPPRLVALSLGAYDGAFIYDSAALLVPGALVPILKTIIEKWFMRLLPMPYAIARLLPGDGAVEDRS